MDLACDRPVGSFLESLDLVPITDENKGINGGLQETAREFLVSIFSFDNGYRIKVSRALNSDEVVATSFDREPITARRRFYAAVNYIRGGGKIA